MTTRRAGTSTTRRAPRRQSPARGGSKAGGSTKTAKTSKGVKTSGGGQRARTARSATATRAARAQARRRRRRRAALATLLVLGVLVAMSIGPLQTLLTATERVAVLTSSRDQLQAEVDRLEQRKDELSDPEELEIIARSELGLVKPGEDPYVVVGPEDDLDRVRPDEQGTAPADEPWYRRLGRALGLVE